MIRMPLWLDCANVFGIHEMFSRFLGAFYWFPGEMFLRLTFKVIIVYM